MNGTEIGEGTVVGGSYASSKEVREVIVYRYGDTPRPIES